jgi:hypothetical protein
MLNKKVNPREELISLLRGFFATPIISLLGRTGIINRINSKKFQIKDCKEIKNKVFLESILSYLESIGLLKKKKKTYTRTFLGKKILSRSGSFHLIHSYAPFINNLEEILKSKTKKNIQCDRNENILGSGLTNGRKFFPKALDLIKDDDFDIVADIGCGNGDFLSKTISKKPKSIFFASDISSKALSETKFNLKRKFPKKKITYLKSNAIDVYRWSKALNNISSKKNQKILISMWYVIHEISQSNKNIIVNFFKKVNKFCPSANIMIGEIIDLEKTVLANNKNLSIMPEFLFFHEISGQGVLKKKDFEFILKNIPYKLEKSAEYDYVTYKKNKIPSAFVWYLKPVNK